MGGYYEIRLTGPGRRQYRLFCILDNGSSEELRERGFDAPQITAITGTVKDSGIGTGRCSGISLGSRYVASMSSDLIAWIVAIGLGIAVVVLGLRRNLGETTRNWLPRPEGASEQETEILGPSGDRQRRPLSPRQRRWMSGGFLLLGLAYAVMAMLWAGDRLIHAVFAALWVIVAVAYFQGKLPLSVDRSTS